MASQKKSIKSLSVQLRSDLHISRQISDGEPIYVVHDPIAFQTHRLTKLQYTIAVHFSRQRTVSEALTELMQRGRLQPEQEALYIDLVANLYKASIVVLPIHQGEKIYDQFEKTRTLRRKNRLMSALFLRLPLSNPDRFLSRTLAFVAWAFTRWFFIAWLLAGVAGVAIVAMNFREFTEPLNGILAPDNLPILWIVFVALKLWHELGHGYACKRFGASVPEMGTILIVGNPLAYVDATAAWSLPERWKRLVVMCGGMYFESLVAIPAVFIWIAVGGHGTIGAIAYQVVIMASAVTILFNANPLMKFDGYFILSELVRIPNLRARADAQIRRLLKALVLGIRVGETELPATAAFLVAFGFSSMLYRVTLVLSIAMLIAAKLPAVGIAIGAYYVGSTLLGTIRRVGTYLLSHAETAAVRVRARFVAFLLFLGMPGLFAFVPVPFGIATFGVVGSDVEHHVRVETPGTLLSPLTTPGMSVEPGDELFRLQSETLVDQFEITTERLHEATLKWKIARERDLAESARIESDIQNLLYRRDEAARRVTHLQIEAPVSGTVARSRAPFEVGTFLPVGESVALIIDGEPVVRAWLTQDQLDHLRRDASETRVDIRVAGQFATIPGRLRSISPAATARPPDLALTSMGGGAIVVDPETNLPLNTLFEVEIVPESQALTVDHHGRRVAISFPRVYESIGAWSYRKCVRVLQTLLLA